MRKLICLFSILLAINYSYAQEKNGIVQEIGEGTHLSYLFDLHGQKRMIGFDIKMSSDTLVLDWSLSSLYGSFLILPEALKSADGMSFKRGEHQSMIELMPNETFCMISRKAFQDLKSIGRFIYNSTTYVLQREEALMVDGRPVHTLQVKAMIDETEMWIINNPSLPMIGKMARNPLGINFTLTSLQVK